MALFVRSLVVVAFAIFVGACAGKKVATEVPKQPNPEVSSGSPNFETPEEHKARQKEIAEIEEEGRNRLEKQIEETRETSEQRKRRLEGLKEAELEGMVYKPSPEEQQIYARAQEIELEEARKKAQKAKQRGDTPAIQQARREAARLKKQQEEVAKVTAEAVRDARLTGCDPATVGIRALDERFDPFAVFPSTLRLRIQNQGSTPLFVDTSFKGYGDIIMNLCSGGAVSRTFKLNSWEPSQQVPLTFWTKLPSGKVVSEIRYFFLQKSYQQQWIWNEVVNVNLDNR